MILHLQWLRLQNFKGIRDLKVDFGYRTDIKGENATGKTTIEDAFFWLFFGKASSGSSDFNIKTLDADGEVIPQIPHSVEAGFLIDSMPCTATRVYSEKWTKVKGRKKEFTGHTTEYAWNGVPLKESEYRAKIEALVPERTFRLLADPYYFNSLPWQERRQALLALTSPIDPMAILDDLNKDNSFNFIAQAISFNKSVDDIKREIESARKAREREIQDLPARIDEAKLSLPPEMNYDILSAQIANVENFLTNIEAELFNINASISTRYKDRLARAQEIFDLKTQIQRLEFDATSTIRQKAIDRERVIMDKKVEARMLSNLLANLQVQRNTKAKAFLAAVEAKENLAKEWREVSASSFEMPVDSDVCPTCKRTLDINVIENKRKVLEQNFNLNKTTLLSAINTNGRATGEIIKTTQLEIDKIIEDIATNDAKLKELLVFITSLEQEDKDLRVNEETTKLTLLEGDSEYQGLKEMLRLRQEEYDTPISEDEARTNALAQKEAIEKKLLELRNQLATKETRERIEARIKELDEKELQTSSAISYLEGQEAKIAAFQRKKMEILEARINKQFSHVNFRMFSTLINGLTVDTCTTLLGGVPYDSLNFAGRVQAGIDIINTFSKIYKTITPIWVDNRESILKLPETEAQIVNLIVVPGVKKIEVENYQRTEEFQL